MFSKLSEQIKNGDLEYDVVTGVSVGGGNMAGVASFKPGQEEEAGKFLVEVWRSVTTKSLFKQWPGGIIQGLLFEAGIFDNSPMEDLIKTIMNGRGLFRKTTLGTVDANSAEFVTYNYNATGDVPPDFITSVVSSGSLPGIFPYVIRDDGKVLIDGGIIYNANLMSAIHRCREVVDSDKDIIVDAILCSQSEMATKDVSKWNTF